ncbi:MAG: glycine--tRNA ligase subunit beta [Campylobacterota bacterium]|nr:glycine--tRNA ligase subunit beta [Campylobacterota bacterium]
MLQALLIEIGVEELPAVPLLKELNNIEKKWAKVLEENALLCEFEFYYTPRRLVLWHREFPLTQADSVEEMFGAPIAVAYKDGEPTKAAEGFARKCGVGLDEIARAEKGGKEVLYFKREIKGQESATLLNEMISSWIKSLSFGKSMRWGSASESFIRPIRWLNVMLGDTRVEAELFGVKSAKSTYVHRMASFEAIDVSDAHRYFEILNEGAVTLFQDDRRLKILNDFAALSHSDGFDIEVDEDLLEEVVAITEHPTALLGNFDEEFLRLPPEVIITSMKEHQRYFPVFKDGKLVNKFVVVTNALADDYSKVIEGNERVLRPRLADGLFFYDNDLNNGLSVAGLEKVVFMKGLGSLSDKIAREQIIAANLFQRYSKQICAQNAKTVEENRTLLTQSVALAKADLMSEMVYEFTELQGLMGYYYASQLGEADEVALAIKEQYLPSGEESELPSTVLSAIVAMSIKLDTLLGLFSINQIPTGSRDPFALRRAVNGIIRISKEHNLEFDIVSVIRDLGDNYDDIDYTKLDSFIIERINQFYDVNPSIIKAVLSSGERELLELHKKVAAVNTIATSESFTSVFSTFKRVANITKDFDVSQALHVKSGLLEEEAEKALYEAFEKVNTNQYETYEARLDALFSLKPQLDTFFNDVMVNAQDESIKMNRKSLVGSIYKALLEIADIKEISV